MRKFCADVNPGKGRVHDCLETHLKELDMECKEAEFKELTLDRMQHDLNLNPRIHYSCEPELNEYCSDADDKTECLTKLRLENEDNTESSMTISLRCSNALDKYMTLNSQWTNLNPRIVKYCNEDMTRLCGKFFSPAARNIKNILYFFRKGKSMDYHMMSCLEKNADKIESPDCASAVQRDLVKRNSDVRFSPEVQSKCGNDITRFCGDVRPGFGRVEDCLQDHFNDLSDSCKEVDLELARQQARSIKYMPRIKKRCKSEMKRYCTDISPENMFRCVRDNVLLQHKDANEKCVAVLRKMTRHRGKDVSLNLGLMKDCREELHQFCENPRVRIKDPISCLIRNVNEMKNSKCKAQVLEQVKLRADDEKVSRVESDACALDVCTLCSLSFSFFHYHVVVYLTPHHTKRYELTAQI